MPDDSEPMAEPMEKALYSEADRPCDPVVVRPVLEPVAESERVEVVDVLRGVAVLGILAMNIVSFALPGDCYIDPMSPAAAAYAGEFRGWNLVVWWVQFLFFEQKMMGIFSMLFGAGLVLMSDRASAGLGLTGTAGVYYRRLGWLLVIGMAHAYGLWYGDILVSYALCGAMLYPARRFKTRVLLVVACILMLGGVAVNFGIGSGMQHLKDQAQPVRELIERGEEPSAEQQELLERWNDLADGLEPSKEKVELEVQWHRAGYMEILHHNARESVFMQTYLLFTFSVWKVSGMMLLGMALARSGVTSALRSIRFYVWMACAGYGLGLPLVFCGGMSLIENQFDMVYSIRLGWQYNYLGSIGVALGHVAAIMLVWRAGVLRWLTRPLAAVGRMALSNYLMHTLVCTFLFYGWGLGMFGTMERSTLMLVVLGIWVVQLAISPVWLSLYRFGPAEWMWRSLTYWKPQAMRRLKPC